ncbi:MAG: hypothetical protein AAB432_03265 [Patescibacteria group bacterium]
MYNENGISESVAAITVCWRGGVSAGDSSKNTGSAGARRYRDNVSEYYTAFKFRILRQRRFMKRSGADGAWHEKATVVVNLNWNSDNRDWNLNANRLDDNKWNEGNRVFFRRLPVIFLPNAFALGSFIFFAIIKIVLFLKLLFRKN